MGHTKYKILKPISIFLAGLLLFSSGAVRPVGAEPASTQGRSDPASRVLKERLAIESQLDSRLRDEETALEERRQAIEALLEDSRASTSVEQISIDAESKKIVSYKGGYVEATAVGCGTTVAQAEERARTVARSKLSEILLDIPTSGQSSVSRNAPKRPGALPREKVDAFLKSRTDIIPAGSKELSDGTKVVALKAKVPIAGAKDSVSKLAAPVFIQEAKSNPTELLSVPAVDKIKKAIPDPVRQKQVQKAYNRVGQKKPITGLIVNASGLKYSPVMYPEVVTAENKEIYGALKVSQRYMVNVGMSGWASSVDEAMCNDRVGSSPLVVNAASISQRKKLVVSTEDALDIMVADARDGFLGKCRVIVVVD